MTPQQLQLLSTVASISLALTAFISIGLAFLTLRMNLRYSKVAKMADILLSTTQRFDSVYEKYRSIDFSKDLDEEGFRRVRQFWSLQFEQFQYFRHGLIEIEVMTYWLLLRQREHEAFLIRLGTESASYEKTICDQIEDFQSLQFSNVLNKVILNRQHAGASEISKSLKQNWLQSRRWRAI